MASEKKFLKKAIAAFAVKKFLEKELNKAGVSEVVIQKTPIATRISIFVRRPGIVVGKKGKTIKDLCDILLAKFGIDNPQIEVVEVQHPELDAKLVAEKIGRQIEIRGNVKQILRFTLKEIMGSNAIGAEIRIGGKVVGKGGKAKVLTARAGYLKKSGEQMKLVKVGTYTAYPKAGAIGITVKIVPPETKFHDQFSAKEIEETLVKPEALPIQETPVEEKPAEIPKEEKPVKRRSPKKKAEKEKTTEKEKLEENTGTTE